MPRYFVPLIQSSPTAKRWLSQSMEYVSAETRTLFEPYVRWYNWGARAEDLVDPRFVPMAFDGRFPVCVVPGRLDYLVFNEPERIEQGAVSGAEGAQRYGLLVEAFGWENLIVGGWLSGTSWLIEFLEECRRLKLRAPERWHMHGYCHRTDWMTVEEVIAWWEVIMGMVSGTFVITEYGSIDGHFEDFEVMHQFIRGNARIVGDCPFTMELTGYERWYPISWPVPAMMGLVEGGERTALGELWLGNSKTIS
jgi:hypothetical protein